MSIILELQPEIEQNLLAQAQARGVSIEDYVQQIVAREAHAAHASHSGIEARNLVELFGNSPFRGLNIEFERDRDDGRQVIL